MCSRMSHVGAVLVALSLITGVGRVRSESVDGTGCEPETRGQGSVAEERCRRGVRRYLALGLPANRLGEFVASGRSLTEWYNHEVLGGRRQKIVGWVLFGVGALLAVGGGVLFAAIAIDDLRTDSSDGWGTLYGALYGGPFVLLGLTKMLIGLPVALWGTLRMRRWLADGELDRMSPEELERWRERNRVGKKRRLSFLPYLAPGGGGLTMSVHF